MMNLWTRILPRWANSFVAFIGGYYWLPCDRCGKMHGGHEFEFHPTIHSYGKSLVNCPWCRAEGHPYTSDEAVT